MQRHAGSRDVALVLGGNGARGAYQAGVIRWGCRPAFCGLRIGPEARSLVMFQSDYSRRLLELGEADAEAQRDVIDTLLDTEPTPRGSLEGRGLHAPGSC